MKKCDVLFLGLAVLGAGFGVRAESTASSGAPASTIRESRGPDHQPVLDFIGPDGSVALRLRLSPENWGREKSRTTFVINPTHTFVAINELSVRPGRNRHWREERYVNTLTFRNARGEVLFAKRNVKYQAAAVSGNGEAVVCLGQGDEKFAGSRRWRVGRASVIVLAGSGREIFRVEEDGVDEGQIRISNNGRWLAYKYFRNEKVRHVGFAVVDLARQDLRELANPPASGLGVVLDDGSIENPKRR